ncbi:conserved hypothetical protein [[Clostridium] ultunense Esp]|nr:conserved hypothetical protein [[Clostridium] ultunense Esp]
MAYKILGIVGSPRRGSNSEVMVKAALKSAEEVPGIETEMIDFVGKKVMPCIGCFKCLERQELCIFKDKDYMAEFYEKWLMADGIIIGSPVYHLAIPGIFKNAIDRLGEGIWGLKKSGAIDSNWFFKVGGVMTQGLGTFGGQEYVSQYLVSHLVLMNCLVVPPENVTVPGVAGTFRDNSAFEPGLIEEYHPKVIENAKIMGKRVAEVLKIVKTGVENLKDELPKEYLDYVLTKDGCEKILNMGHNK